MRLRTVITFVFNIAFVLSQDDETKKAIDGIFTQQPPKSTDFLDKYEEVTKKTPGSIGALEKCGEGSGKGVNLCVPYYQCDGVTKLIVQTGVTDGFGIIDIRFGENSCPHPLDVCCGIPPGFNPSVKEPTKPEPVNPETPKPVTTRPAVTPTTRRPSDTPRFCGIRNPNGIDFKITGNKDNEAEYGEFPWMVSILKKNFNPSQDKNLAICGGSLISPNVVLTGAHCVYKYKTNEIKVRAGEWDTQTTKERLPYQERDVAQIITHKDFNPNTLYDDFALVVLTSYFDQAENIGTVCLPQQNEIINSRNCFASGWGKDVFGKEGKYQVILKKIELPIVQREKCENALRTTRLSKLFNLHNSFICAGGEEGRDTCTGDGGSPLVCPDPQNNRRYVQAGIVAWGIGCGESEIPGVYADVAKYRNWIDDQMERLNLDTKPYNL